MFQTSVNCIPIQAIFFDYDNTLGFTEVVALGESYEVLKRALSSKGVEELQTSKEEFIATSAGRTFREILHEFAQFHSIIMDEVEVDGWVLEEKNQVIRQLGVRCKPTPGANELLEMLLPTPLVLAVVSSSAPDRIGFCMKAADQERFGLRIFSCQAPGYAIKAKPAPDVYLQAADVMGVNPAASVAIEDSPSGAISALSAGMKVILFSGAEEASDEEFARRLHIRIEEKVQTAGATLAGDWRGRIVTCIDDLRLVPEVIAALEEGRQLPIFLPCR